MEKSEAISSLNALIPFLGITFIIVIGVILLNHRFRKNLYERQIEQERERMEHQQRILQTTIQVQEDERERFAKDLHDELGAMLSISKHWLAQLEEKSTENKQKITEINELIGSVLQSTRRISHDLMPLHLETMGFEYALRSLINRAEQSGNLNVQFSISPQLEEMDSLVKISLYRIYSELINNTVKYAQAKEIQLTIRDEVEFLQCYYTDNGIGINLEKNAEGLGMRSISMRLKAMNGSWKYGNRTEEGGFFANLSIPK